MKIIPVAGKKAYESQDKEHNSNRMLQDVPEIVITQIDEDTIYEESIIKFSKNNLGDIDTNSMALKDNDYVNMMESINFGNKKTENQEFEKNNNELQDSKSTPNCVLAEQSVTKNIECSMIDDDSLKENTEITGTTHSTKSKENLEKQTSDKEHEKVWNIHPSSLEDYTTKNQVIKQGINQELNNFSQDITHVKEKKGESKEDMKGEIIHPNVKNSEEISITNETYTKLNADDVFDEKEIPDTEGVMEAETRLEKGIIKTLESPDHKVTYRHFSNKDNEDSKIQEFQSEIQVVNEITIVTEPEIWTNVQKGINQEMTKKIKIEKVVNIEEVNLNNQRRDSKNMGSFEESVLVESLDAVAFHKIISEMKVINNEEALLVPNDSKTVVSGIQYVERENIVQHANEKTQVDNLKGESQMILFQEELETQCEIVKEILKTEDQTQLKTKNIVEPINNEICNITEIESSTGMIEIQSGPKVTEEKILVQNLTQDIQELFVNCRNFSLGNQDCDIQSRGDNVEELTNEYPIAIAVSRNEGIQKSYLDSFAIINSKIIEGSKLRQTVEQQNSEVMAEEINFETQIIFEEGDDIQKVKAPGNSQTLNDIKLTKLKNEECLKIINNCQENPIETKGNDNVNVSEVKLDGKLLQHEQVEVLNKTKERHISDYNEANEISKIVENSYCENECNQEIQNIKEKTQTTEKKSSQKELALETVKVLDSVLAIKEKQCTYKLFMDGVLAENKNIKTYDIELNKILIQEKEENTATQNYEECEQKAPNFQTFLNEGYYCEQKNIHYTKINPERIQSLLVEKDSPVETPSMPFQTEVEVINTYEINKNINLEDKKVCVMEEEYNKDKIIEIATSYEQIPKKIGEIVNNTSTGSKIDKKLIKQNTARNCQNMQQKQALFPKIQSQTETSLKDVLKQIQEAAGIPNQVGTLETLKKRKDKEIKIYDIEKINDFEANKITIHEVENERVKNNIHDADADKKHSTNLIEEMDVLAEVIRVKEKVNNPIRPTEQILNTENDLNNIHMNYVLPISIHMEQENNSEVKVMNPVKDFVNKTQIDIEVRNDKDENDSQVTSIDVIENISSDVKGDKEIKETAEMLNPGGALIIVQENIVPSNAVKNNVTLHNVVDQSNNSETKVMNEIKETLTVTQTDKKSRDDKNIDYSEVKSDEVIKVIVGIRPSTEIGDKKMKETIGTLNPEGAKIKEIYNNGNDNEMFLNETLLDEAEKKLNQDFIKQFKDMKCKLALVNGKECLDITYVNILLSEKTDNLKMVNSNDSLEQLDDKKEIETEVEIYEPTVEEAIKVFDWEDNLNITDNECFDIAHKNTTFAEKVVEDRECVLISSSTSNYAQRCRVTTAEEIMHDQDIVQNTKTYERSNLIENEDGTFTPAINILLTQNNVTTCEIFYSNNERVQAELKEMEQIQAIENKSYSKDINEKIAHVSKRLNDNIKQTIKVEDVLVPVFDKNLEDGQDINDTPLKYYTEQTMNYQLQVMQNNQFDGGVLNAVAIDNGQRYKARNITDFKDNKTNSSLKDMELERNEQNNDSELKIIQCIEKTNTEIQTPSKEEILNIKVNDKEHKVFSYHAPGSNNPFVTSEIMVSTVESETKLLKEKFENVNDVSRVAYGEPTSLSIIGTTNGTLNIKLLTKEMTANDSVKNCDGQLHEVQDIKITPVVTKDNQVQGQKDEIGSVNLKEKNFKIKDYKYVKELANKTSPLTTETNFILNDEQPQNSIDISVLTTVPQTCFKIKDIELIEESSMEAQTIKGRSIDLREIAYDLKSDAIAEARYKIKEKTDFEAIIKQNEGVARSSILAALVEYPLKQINALFSDADIAFVKGREIQSCDGELKTDLKTDFEENQQMKFETQSQVEEDTFEDATEQIYDPVDILKSVTVLENFVECEHLEMTDTETASMQETLIDKYNFIENTTQIKKMGEESLVVIDKVEAKISDNGQRISDQECVLHLNVQLKKEAVGRNDVEQSDISYTNTKTIVDDQFKDIIGTTTSEGRNMNLVSVEPEIETGVEETPKLINVKEISFHSYIGGQALQKTDFKNLTEKNLSKIAEDRENITIERNDNINDHKIGLNEIKCNNNITTKVGTALDYVIIKDISLENITEQVEEKESAFNTFTEEANELSGNIDEEFEEIIRAYVEENVEESIKSQNVIELHDLLNIHKKDLNSPTIVEKDNVKDNPKDQHKISSQNDFKIIIAIESEEEQCHITQSQLEENNIINLRGTVVENSVKETQDNSNVLHSVNVCTNKPTIVQSAVTSSTLNQATFLEINDVDSPSNNRKICTIQEVNQSNSDVNNIFIKTKENKNHFKDIKSQAITVEAIDSNILGTLCKNMRTERKAGDLSELSAVEDSRLTEEEPKEVDEILFQDLVKDVQDTENEKDSGTAKRKRRKGKSYAEDKTILTRNDPTNRSIKQRRLSNEIKIIQTSIVNPADIVRANDPLEDDLPKDFEVYKYVEYFESLIAKK